MRKILFYIIIISQSWLTLGTFCVQLINPDHELVEIFNEEEQKEKEKELETEEQKIKNYDGHNLEEALVSQISRYIQEYTILLGRNHVQDFTPPPRA